MVLIPQNADDVLTPQDAEREKESILQQFADLTRRRAEVDEVQKPLLDELNQIKVQINEFDQKRTEIRVNRLLASYGLSRILTRDSRIK